MADDNRRQVLLLLKDGEKTPTEMAKSFEFTLPALLTHLRVLRDTDLVRDRKVGQNRFYSVNKEKMSEMIEFFDIFWIWVPSGRYFLREGLFWIPKMRKFRANL